MKKIIASVVIALMLVGCGSSSSTASSATVNYDYYYAYISAPDGTIIEGDVGEARMYKQGIMKIVINDTTYFTGAENVLLVRR